MTKFSKLMMVIIMLAVQGAFAAQGSQKNYFNKADGCILRSDLKNISTHFKQFLKYANKEKEELCLQEMGADWLQIARSVLAMQRIDVEPIERDENDDFTRRAIDEKDWWAYFKQRATKFVIPEQCRANVVAYVITAPWLRGQIHLCRPYFEMDVPGQIEVLMHEVRHFDGHGHVPCTRGVAKGRPGACDETITSQGSYAISVQAGVELSFSKQLSAAQRSVSEAGAIFLMVNRFNKIPKVKANNYIYLSNTLGEIWKSTTQDGTLDNLSMVGELEEPSKIYSNGSALTVYPLNLQSDAYRISSDLSGKIETIGSFAEKYNSESIMERAKYKSFSYLGTGSIAKGNDITSSCSSRSGLSTVAFSPENIKGLINFESRPFELTTNVLGESGSVYELDCNASLGQLSVKKLDLQIPSFVNSSFTIDDVQFALTDNGVLTYFDYSQSSTKPELVPVLDKDNENVWVSATPINSFEIFDRGQGQQVLQSEAIVGL